MNINSDNATALVTMDRGVREEECAQLTSLSRVSRWRLEVKGRFPVRRKVGSNHYWLLSELMEWLQDPGCYQSNL